jgi:hypothetical protein
METTLARALFATLGVSDESLAYVTQKSKEDKHDYVSINSSKLG